MRRMNLGYKVLMSGLCGVNIFLASFSQTPPLYFEIVSILTSACPVVWSQVLDACKEYHSDSTPTEGSPALPSTTPSINTA